MDEGRAATLSLHPGPGPVRYHVLRMALAFVVGAYVRIRYEGGDRLPDEAYILCFNHRSWLDPIVLAASWPDRRRRLLILGPRERDMQVGLRNRMIVWTHRDVPLKPGGVDTLDVARRATAVLRRGDLLAIAGEGHLTTEGLRLDPLEPGIGHFAMRAGVPIVPVAIIGTRWVRLGGTVRIRIGGAVAPSATARGRTGAEDLTARVEEELRALLGGTAEPRPPGRFGRWLSEAFNERS
jgi:1-acyl-sn-glycerol-3-phosphate acyltransferase